MYSEIKAGADSIKEVRRGGEVLWQRYPSPIVINKNTFRRYFRPNFEPLGHKIPFTNVTEPVATNIVHLEPGRKIRSIDFIADPIEFEIRLMFEHFKCILLGNPLRPYDRSISKDRQPYVKNALNSILEDMNHTSNEDCYFYLAMSPQETTDTGLLFAKYDIEIRVEYK